MTERDMVVNLIELREKKAVLTEQLAEVQDSLNKVESSIIESFSDKEIKTIKYEGLGSIIIPKARLYASYQKENEDDVFKFVRDRGDGALIREAIHPSSLSKFVDTLLTSGREVPGIFEYYFKQGLRFKKL